MEDQHFLDEDHLQTQNERPTFLTVLCIITFVVSGFLLISTIWSAISFDAEVQTEIMEEKIAELESNPSLEKNPMRDTIIDSMEMYSKEAIELNSTMVIISLLSLLLSLLGAFMMFNLKKIGFHLYVVSKILAISPLFILSFNFMTGMVYITIGFFALVFIIMYGVNRKYMS